MIPDLKRWTPLVFLFPNKYVEKDKRLKNVDIHDWRNNHFRWRQDPYSGWKDIAKKPWKTYIDGSGDCEDYSILVASWALTKGKRNVGLGFCWRDGSPIPSHVIAYTDDMVYSTDKVGNIEGSVQEYLDRSEYRWLARRPVKP